MNHNQTLSCPVRAVGSASLLAFGSLQVLFQGPALSFTSQVLMKG